MPEPRRVPSRVIIEGVDPEIDGGRFPIKRSAGEEVQVGADIFADGHEVLSAVLRYRPAAAETWTEVSMEAQPNDRWTASFTVTLLGEYEYTVQAWIDRYASWKRDLSRKVEANQDVSSELLEGSALVKEVAGRVSGSDADWLRFQAEQLARPDNNPLRVQTALDPLLAGIMSRNADRSIGMTHERVLKVKVDRERARYGAWYELFPRSTGEPGKHGTFKDVERRLPYVADMGFDVLYLPPIHPIGLAYRKGPNNTLTPGPDDPGSPWAIGGPEGGHKAIHPELGTFADFDHLVHAAQEHGIEIALDIAFQCSPDHPYVRAHPEWFRHRPDGTIKYAENPPKKYQDIYPLDFECADWQGLYQELLDVILFWIGHGVRIFRVDNPHTKPFRFWDWLIGKVYEKHPDVIFLSEAFTRPKVMRRLAKGGFTQSYTYFTWRNTKPELIEYFTELNQTQSREYMRPNLFANTPDILPEYLQFGGRNAHYVRIVLAATLGATYGIYGPVYENFDNRPVRQHSEEYLDSEKYQLRQWDWQRPNVFREFIARVNRIRRENPALHYDHNLRFFHTDNEQILFYGKRSPDLASNILVIVNLDPHHVQSGWIHVPIEQFGLQQHDSYQMHDLLTDAYFLWHGERNFVQLDPTSGGAHIFRLRKRVKSERDFDYFM